ncbi:reverse transcriptase family protein [Shewanella submarina]|uniref:Reverse transcriptase family protein n=1 Tax=Shewanella submarina TaxID=2016376 RepID=A0ABV7G9A2_9GAMM|nr:reverse transcriptase family protein [Shewanella submarina]MCL1039529.1 reverse transcriptase family protein [Shewanella submarina]
MALALGISEQELHSLTKQSDSLFFRTKLIDKPDGTFRETFDVAPGLKSIHAKICAIFFKRVNYPDYLQGSLKQRDYISDAKKHVGSKLLISEDISNFFPSISKKIVVEMWVGVFKFSPEVAECLAELVTKNGFVVQGAKTSSYVCNLILWNREALLANSLKAKGLTYSRYVDDVTVSAKRELNLKEKSEVIKSIYSVFMSVGAKPNRKKHKIMPRSGQQDVHGVNVNKLAPSMPKTKRNQIRAAVNCCERKFVDDPSSLEYIALFNSTLGRVNTLARMHKREAQQLKERLTKIKPIKN